MTGGIAPGAGTCGWCGNTLTRTGNMAYNDLTLAGVVGISASSGSLSNDSQPVYPCAQSARGVNPHSPAKGVETDTVRILRFLTQTLSATGTARLANRARLAAMLAKAAK